MKTLEYIWGWITDVYNFIGGVLMALFGYLLPIRDLVHFITILFILDVIMGIWKSKKLYKAKFQPRIIWKKTIPRWLISVVIISLLFAWDKVHHQELINTYYIGGYFLSGMVIVSIIENSILITDWKVLRHLRELIVDKIEKNTGLDIDEEDESRDK